MKQLLDGGYRGRRYIYCRTRRHTREKRDSLHLGNCKYRVFKQKIVRLANVFDAVVRQLSCEVVYS